MDSKDLKKLNRRELLELLVQVSETNEQLRTELDQLKDQLEQRRLSAPEVGTLAEAALVANNFFVDADRAAKQFTENLFMLEQATKERCTSMLKETLDECMQMRKEAGFPDDQLVPERWAKLASRKQG